MAEKQTPEQLMAEVNRLQELLAKSEEKRTEAEELAHSMASSSPFLHSNVEEKPTGRTLSVKEIQNKTERDPKKVKYHMVEYPTFYYNIQLPAGSGPCLMTNGMEYFHGETYEFTQAELGDIKSRVARCWEHEKNIHGENENAFKKPTNTHFKSPAASARGL